MTSRHLFILGDLVEYWIGDDADDGTLDEFFDRLAQLPTQGCRTTFMHGNRDFLIGTAFAARTHLELVDDDTYVYEDEHTRLLLMHGDTLCTDDADYQSMRATLRDPEWQHNFLQQSVAQRREYAMQLRATSQSRSAEKAHEITDVSSAAVGNVMQQAQVTSLLHGHTHRPAQHQLTVNDQAATRWVVGDWHPTQAIYGVLDSGVIRLETFR